MKHEASGDKMRKIAPVLAAVISSSTVMILSRKTDWSFQGNLGLSPWLVLAGVVAITAMLIFAAKRKASRSLNKGD